MWRSPGHFLWTARYYILKPLKKNVYATSFLSVCMSDCRRNLHDEISTELSLISYGLVCFGYKGNYA